jgi:hypothetical protein
LIGTEIAFGPRPVGRKFRQGTGRPADEGRRRRQSRIRACRERWHGPALRHGDREGPPRAIAGGSLAQRSARQGDRVQLSGLVIERDGREREDVRNVAVEDERFVELDAVERPALGAEPARAGDRLEVERRDRSSDLGACRRCDLRSPS